TSFFSRNKVIPNEELLDPAMIAELRGMPASDGLSMLEELVDLFLQTAPARLAQISNSLNQPQQLSFHAHALKSMSLNLGAKRVIELCRKLEELGRSGNLAGVDGLFSELQAAFTQTKAHLLPLRR